MIVFMLIISPFELMAQAAPITLTKRAPLIMTNQTVLESRLYCVAKDLYNARGQLSRGNLQDAEYKTDDSNAKKLSNLFYDRCKEFTIAMTLKHQLLDDFFKADTAPNLGIKNPEKLSMILTSLQTMSDIFYDMELNENDRRCLELTPTQYKIMYKARYTTSVLQSLGDLDKWYRDPDLHPDMKDLNILSPS